MKRYLWLVIPLGFLALLVRVAFVGLPWDPTPAEFDAAVERYAQKTPTPVPSPTPAATETPLPLGCSYESKTTGDKYLYRSNCGGGYFVIYLHDGKNPSEFKYFVRVDVVSDAKWVTKAANEDWIALFGSQASTRNAVCQAMYHLGPKRQLAPGSEWILGNESCQ